MNEASAVLPIYFLAPESRSPCWHRPVPYSRAEQSLLARPRQRHHDPKSGNTGHAGLRKTVHKEISRRTGPPSLAGCRSRFRARSEALEPDRRPADPGNGDEREDSVCVGRASESAGARGGRGQERDDAQASRASLMPKRSACDRTALVICACMPCVGAGRVESVSVRSHKEDVCEKAGRTWYHPVKPSSLYTCWRQSMAPL